MARQEPAHNGGNWHITALQQQVEVIGYQSPGKAPGTGLSENTAEPIDKAVTVIIIHEHLAALNAADDDVVKCAGGVDAGLSWHTKALSSRPNTVKLVY
jgi:hypothetical protein